MKFIALCLVAALSLGAAGAGWPQAGFPAKPVKIVVGFPPGSSGDLVARVLAPRLADSLGQTFVIENKPGAGSNIATEGVVRAPADGYTLLMGTIANTINATLNRNLSFDFSKDLAPVIAVASVPTLLVVHPSFPARSVRELIAIAKPKPGEYLYASSGNGTANHLAGELFNLMAGVKLIHVPYKGSPQAVADLLAGRVLVMFSPASTALPHIRAGSLRALASTGEQRTGVAPELPTVAESGLPGFETSVWFGLLAPAATPRDIVDRIAAAAAQGLRSAEVKAQFAAQGIDPLGGGPREFASYIREEIAKWAKVIQASGAKID